MKKKTVLRVLIPVLLLAVAGAGIRSYGNHAEWLKRNQFLSQDIAYDASLVQRAYAEAKPQETSCSLKIKTQDVNSITNAIEHHCAYERDSRCVVVPVETDIDVCPLAVSAVMKALYNPCDFMDEEAVKADPNDYWDSMYREFNCSNHPRKASYIKLVPGHPVIFVSQYK